MESKEETAINTPVSLPNAVPIEEYLELVETIKQLKVNVDGLQASNEELRRQLADKSEHNNDENDNVSVAESFATLPEAPQQFVQKPVKIYDLPQFSGVIAEWPLFIESFKETTNMFKYNDRINLMRLQKCLTGGAKDAVAALLIHPKDVKNVIDELEFRYGRPELMVRDQMAKLQELPGICLANTEQVMSFSTKVRNVVALLSTPNCEHHLSNTTLLEEVVAKLPLAQQLEWAKYAIKIKPYATLQNFSVWMSELARVISAMPLQGTKRDRPTKPRQIMHVNKDDKMQQCYLCSCNHRVATCPQYESYSVPDRWEKVKSLALCFGCLQKGHNLAGCTMKSVCDINGCKKYHHSSLHADNTLERCQNVTQPHILMNCQSSRTELFKILPITVFGPNGKMEIFAMIDEGSSISMLDEHVAAKLGLHGQNQLLTLKWYGDRTTTEPSSKVCFEIQGRSNRFIMKGVQTVKNLDLPSQTFKKSEFAYLKNIDLTDYVDAKPTLLLGLDHVYLGVPTDIIEGDQSQPIAADTKLGWVVYGPVNRTYASEKHSMVVNVTKNEAMENLHRLVVEYYDTDSFGLNNIHTKLESKEDKAARNILTSSVKHINGRYEIGLLWKKVNPVLPENINMAKKRFYSTEAKMGHDSNYGERYRKEMSKFFEKGYARILSQEEIAESTAPLWYLPHFAVQNVNKPGKMRLVFDAAATSNNVSLNSELLKGPEQPQDLFEILMKFRQYCVGVAADIREMFLQIKICPDDFNAQRFLWRNTPEEDLQHCVMTSMIFGAICSPCCAEFIKNYNAEKFMKEFPQAAKAIVEKHYVDDFVSSFPTVEEAIQICQQVVKIHTHAGFELRNFVSNCKLLEKTLNKSVDKSSDLVNMEYQATTEKVLGMFWNTSDDVFEFHTKFHRVPLPVLNCDRPPTKREFLSIVMSIYDPFGFIADFVLHSKVMLQELWQHQMGWDDPVPQHIYRRWKIWWKEFTNVNTVKIPRCYFLKVNQRDCFELHIMVDASETAFAAVGYLRIDSQGSIKVSFVAGKTRVAPKKLLSVPRLELQAAVLGVRLSDIIQRGLELTISRIVYWSDSYTVLHWIKSPKRKYKAFVGHRITEVITASQPHQWRWVPTVQNSADTATRTSQPPKLGNQNKWLCGPEFLQLPEHFWPCNNVEPPPGTLEEEIVACYTTKKQEGMIQNLANKFSSYLKLKRVVAWVLRASALFLKQHNSFDSHTWATRLSAKEMIKAEKAICKLAQEDCYSQELEKLRQSLALTKQSQIFALSPYVDEEGLLRVQGRIDYAICLPMETRRPILLPNKHEVTRLIVRHYHELLHHQNFSVAISEIRNKFWIPRLKSLLKRIQQECNDCRIKNAKPVPPLMGQLPPDRLTPWVRPFSYTGVDLFGPINVAVGRQRLKRWAVIFTCLTARAVHFELAEDLSTDAFLLCLRNFVNRRGMPVRIRCDNGTNFIGAQRELKDCERLFDMDRISNECANRNIEWVFNCPGNPSSGGCWERLIRIVKRLLAQVLKDTVPRVETLRSALIEAENIINSRPLTDIPLEHEDDNPLTPNDILLGCPNSTQTPQPVDENICFKKQWRIAQSLKDRFWKRWTLEYLPQLLHRNKWHSSPPPLKIEDTVIVCDPSLPRSQWQKERIIDVFPAKDGHIRIATVKTASGSFRRPVNRLAPLKFGKSAMDLRGEEC